MSADKEIIKTVRRQFLNDYESNKDLYHEKDIENVRENDWPVERFVLVHKTEDLALKALIKAMRWRKSFGVHTFNDQYFPLEVYKLSEWFSYGTDKDGRPVLWFQGKNHYKSAELGTLIRQFTVYQFEKLDSQTSYQGWSIVNDPTNMGLSNVDMDFSNFMIDVLQSYYPRAAKYMAVVDLPWILNATSKIIMAFMSEELRNNVKFIKKDELLNYLNADVIPKHLGGNNCNNMNKIPENAKKLTEMPDLGLTAKQIDKIYSTFKSALKE